MTDYNAMSKLDINRRVSIALGEYREILDGEFVGVVGDTWYAVNQKTRELEQMFVDYCNNPADAWPIIVENKIRLTPRISDDRWGALYVPLLLEHHDENPLRAAMIVYLMIMEGSSND